MQNIIINSYAFSNQHKTNIDGKKNDTNLKGCLRIIKEKPQVQVSWGPKVCVPSNIPFRIKHPVFRNTTYILEDIKLEHSREPVTFLEYILKMKPLLNK
jgi:hypothetical protein